MNALANHGYISRTGVDTVVAMTTASNKGKLAKLGIKQDLHLIKI